MPTDKEKNACPKADRILLDVSSENLGKNRNFKPSEEPLKVVEFILRAITIINNRGIMILEYLSIPFCTPPIMMAPVRNINPVCQSRAL